MHLVVLFIYLLFIFFRGFGGRVGVGQDVFI
jgi:hypothetical protein